MSIDVVLTCPLGHKCEEVVAGKIHRCMWLVKLVGKDPQSEGCIDEEKCAMAWQPILMVENAQTNRGTSHAVESLRNEVVKHSQAQLSAQEHTQKLITQEKIIEITSDED